MGGERSGQGRHKTPGFRTRVGSEMRPEGGSDAISLRDRDTRGGSGSSIWTRAMTSSAPLLPALGPAGAGISLRKGWGGEVLEKRALQRGGADTAP